MLKSSPTFLSKPQPHSPGISALNVRSRVQFLLMTSFCYSHQHIFTEWLQAGTAYYKVLNNNETLYRIRQNSGGGKLSQFSRFLLNRKNFPIEYFTRLGIHCYKKLLPRKFSRRIFIFVLTVKVFPLNCFVIYGSANRQSVTNQFMCY